MSDSVKRNRFRLSDFIISANGDPTGTNEIRSLDAKKYSIVGVVLTQDKQSYCKSWKALASDLVQSYENHTKNLRS